MAKSTKAAEPKDDRREGYRLAINMLHELEASPELCDACGLADPAQQDNIVMRYLHECRTRSPSAEAGFCAVLSDFVADSSDGFCPNAATYQKGLKISVPRRVSKAVKNRRAWKAVQRITGRDDPMPPGWGKSQAAKGGANHG
jgi:hypothetical protein